MVLVFVLKWVKSVLRGVPPSSVDSSAPTILPPWVRVPSTLFTLLSFIVFVLYLPCEKNKNKEKRGRVWPIFKKKCSKMRPLHIPSLWCWSFIEIYWSLVSLAHFITFTLLCFFISTQHLNTLYMMMDLVFVLKWVKSVIGWVLFIFHLSEPDVGNKNVSRPPVSSSKWFVALSTPTSHAQSSVNQSTNWGT